MLIDTHCHLDFLDNPEEKIAAAGKRQVGSIIAPGVTVVSSARCVQLAHNHSGVFAAVGLHPLDVVSQNESVKRQLSGIEKLLQMKKERIVAIGETGLDFGPPPQGETARPPQEQLQLFKSHLELAKKYNLPLIIHNRKASSKLLETLQPFKDQVTGVFHCFVGSKKFLKQVLELGFYVGVTGLITYDQGLQQVIKEVPSDRLLIETDSPYLMPEPIRQEKRWPNEPKHVTIVAEKVAELRGDSFISLAQQTTANAQALFNLTWPK